MEGFIALLVDACSNYDVDCIKDSFSCAVKLSGESFLWRVCDEDEKEHKYKCFNANVDAFCRRYVDCFECDWDVAYLVKLAHGTISDTRLLIARVAKATDLYPSFVSSLFDCDLKSAKDAERHVKRQLKGFNDRERVAIATLECWREDEKRLRTF